MSLFSNIQFSVVTRESDNKTTMILV